jgi:hypothetical protein
MLRLLRAVVRDGVCEPWRASGPVEVSTRKRRFILFLALVALASPVDARVFMQPRFVGPDGQKKVGDYIWVWHSEKFSPSNTGEIEADCPLAHVVIGGGYSVKGAFSVGATTPNAAFDGWIITGLSGYNEGATVTAYASCAPAK